MSKNEQLISNNLIEQHSHAIFELHKSTGEMVENQMKQYVLDVSYHLGKLFDGGAHKVAGFKNFGDYLDANFSYLGNSKTWVNNMKAAKLLGQHNGQAVPLIPTKTGESWQLSTLVILSNIPLADIKNAVQNGEIGPDTPQKDILAWKNKYNESHSTGKVKVVTMWADVNGNEHPEDSLKEQADGEEHIHIWKNGDFLYKFTVYSDGTCSGERFTKVVPADKVHKVGKSKEEKAAELLSSMTADQVKALMEALNLG